MTELDVLVKIDTTYKAYLKDGWSRKDAANRCLNGIPNPPFIHTGEYDEPAYCMLGEYVLIFGSGIFKKMELPVPHKKLCRVRPDLKELHLCACSTNGDFDADANEYYEYRWSYDEKFEIFISNRWVEFESIDFEFGNLD